MDHLRALRVLGLPPGATADEIHTAWRDLAKVWHPDRFAQDERLRQKAGENFSRINQAHEALSDYDPSKTPKIAARVRESVALILGMGELGEPPSPVPGSPAGAVPTGPIGLRRSLRILGLGKMRPTGEVDTRHHRSPATLALVIVTLLAAALGVLAYLLLKR